MHNTSRRQFLSSMAATSVFSIVPASVLRGATAPSNQLTRALIGFGAIAHSGNHLPYKGSRLIALCDPKAACVKDGLACAEKAGWGKVRGFHDFRDILAMADVDIVHICTPPHWHGVMSVMAAKAGKDVWCEKPMTRTVGEGRRVEEVIKATGRMFRLNTWFRFKDGFYGFGTPVKSIKQVVENGLLGKGPIRAIVGAGQGFSLKSFWNGLTVEKPEPVPHDIDWDLWLGPAPYKPFTRDRVGTTFRGYWDYDGGGLGDMGQHYLDPVQYILNKDETSPVKIEYNGPKQHPEAVGFFNRITLTYADGDQIILDGDESLAQEPFLKGPKGSLWPKMKSDIPNLENIVKGLPEPKAQVTDFMQSVRERKTFALNESNGFRSSTIFNLAIVAMRLGRGFEFDPVALRAVNDPAADRFLYQPMRGIWEKEMYS